MANGFTTAHHEARSATVTATARARQMTTSGNTTAHQVVQGAAAVTVTVTASQTSPARSSSYPASTMKSPSGTSTYASRIPLSSFVSKFV